ncbi:thioredoxin [Parasitella parasitica]|nr:thioredoxin [Parasitella parasitica]
MSSAETYEFQTPKNLEEFNKLIEKNALVVVDFHATWCGPCKVLEPKLKKLAVKYTNIVFAKVDVDAVADVAEKYQIRAMPTILFFEDGEKFGETIGANDNVIESKIKELVKE